MFSWFRALKKRKCKAEEEDNACATIRKTKPEHNNNKKKKKNIAIINQLRAEESNSKPIVNREPESKVKKREVVMVPIFNSIPCVNVKEEELCSPSDNNKKEHTVLLQTNEYILQSYKTKKDKNEQNATDTNCKEVLWCKTFQKENNNDNKNEDNLQSTNSPCTNDTETNASTTITNNIVHFEQDGKEKFAAESCSALLSRSYLSLGGVMSHCNNSATDSKRSTEENTINNTHAKNNKNVKNINSTNLCEQQIREMNKNLHEISFTTISSSYNSFSSSMLSTSSSSSSEEASCEESERELDSLEKLEEEEEEEEEQESCEYQLENPENECIKLTVDHSDKHNHEQEMELENNITYKSEKPLPHLDKAYSSLTSVKLARLHPVHHTAKRNKKKRTLRSELVESITSSLELHQEVEEKEWEEGNKDNFEAENRSNCENSSFTSHSYSHPQSLQGAFWTSGPLRNEASSFSEWEAEENKQYAQGKKLSKQYVTVPDQCTETAETTVSINDNENNRISTREKKYSYSSPLNTFDSFSERSQISASSSPPSSSCRRRYSDSTLTLGSRKAIKNQCFTNNHNKFCTENNNNNNNTNNDYNVNLNVDVTNTRSSNSNLINDEFVMSPLHTYIHRNDNNDNNDNIWATSFDKNNNVPCVSKEDVSTNANKENKRANEDECDEMQEHMVKEQTNKTIATRTSSNNNNNSNSHIITHSEEPSALPKNSYGLSNSNDEDDAKMKKRCEEHQYNVVYSPWRHFYSQPNQSNLLCEEETVSNEENKVVDIRGNEVSSPNKLEHSERCKEQRPSVNVYNDSVKREWEELCLTSSDENAEKVQKEEKETETQNTVKGNVVFNEIDTQMSINLQQHAERAAWRRQMKKELESNISQTFYYDDVDNGALKVIRHVLSKEFYLKEEDEANSKTQESNASMKRHSSCSSKNANDNTKRKRSSVSVNNNNNKEKRKKSIREKIWRGSISTSRIINKKNEHLSKYYCNSHKQFLETLKAGKKENQEHCACKATESAAVDVAAANASSNSNNIAQPEKEKLEHVERNDYYCIDSLFTVLPVPLEKRVAGRVTLEAYYVCYQGKPKSTNEESQYCCSCNNSNKEGNKKYSVISSEKSNVSTRRKYSKSVNDSKKLTHRKSNYSVRSKSTNVLHSKVPDENQAVHPLKSANDNNLCTNNSKNKSNMESHSLEEGDVCDGKCHRISRLGRNIDTSFCSRMLKTKEKGQKLRDDWSRPSLHFSLASSLVFENSFDDNQNNNINCANNSHNTQEIVEERQEENKESECINVDKNEENIDDDNNNRSSHKDADKLVEHSDSECLKDKSNNDNTNKTQKCARQLEHRQHIATIITEEDNLREQPWKHETLGKNTHNSYEHCKSNKAIDNAVHQTELPDVRPSTEEISVCNHNSDNYALNTRMFSSPPIDIVVVTAPTSILKKQSELPSLAKEGVKCHAEKDVIPQRQTSQRNVANKTIYEHYRNRKKRHTSELGNNEYSNSLNTIEHKNSEHGEGNHKNSKNSDNVDEKSSLCYIVKGESRALTENSLSDVETFDRECESEPRSYQRINKHYSSNTNGNGNDDARSSKSIATTMTTMTTNTITSSSVGANNSRECHNMINDNEENENEENEIDDLEEDKVNIRYRLCELHSQASKSGISSTNTSHYITNESNSSRIGPICEEHEYDEEEEPEEEEEQQEEEEEESSLLSSQKQMTDQPFLFSYSQRTPERVPLYTSRTSHKIGLLESSKNNRMSNIHTAHLNRYNSNDESSVVSISNNNRDEEKKDNTLSTSNHLISKTDGLTFANLTEEDDNTKPVQVSTSTRWTSPFNLIGINNSIKTLSQSANESVNEEISSLSKTERSNNPLMKRHKQIKMRNNNFARLEVGVSNEKNRQSNLKREIELGDINNKGDDADCKGTVQNKTHELQKNSKNAYVAGINTNKYKIDHTNELSFSNTQKCLHEQEELQDVHSIAQLKNRPVCTSSDKSVSVDIERARTIPEWREECISSSESSMCAMLSCTVPNANKLRTCNIQKNVKASDETCLDYEAEQLHEEESRCKVNVFAETKEMSTTQPPSHLMLNVEHIKHNNSLPQESTFDVISPNARTANASITEVDKKDVQ